MENSINTSPPHKNEFFHPSIFLEDFCVSSLTFSYSRFKEFILCKYSIIQKVLEVWPQKITFAIQKMILQIKRT